MGLWLYPSLICYPSQTHSVHISSPYLRVVTTSYTYYKILIINKYFLNEIKMFALILFIWFGNLVGTLSLLSFAISFQLFNFVKDGDARHTNYQLMGIVCYYGKHYSTFMWHTKSKSWVYFDDATVKDMGRNFQDVIDKCCKGRYQPLLLMYANPDGQAIDPSTAPKATYPVTTTIQPRHSRSKFLLSWSSSLLMDL
jgi:hypothetical protein